jgi:hypothetical protein
MDKKENIEWFKKALNEGISRRFDRKIAEANALEKEVKKDDKPKEIE